MKGSKFGINVFVMLLLACELFDVTIASGHVQSLFRYIVILWSFIYYIKTLANYQKEPTIIKALTVFYLLLAIYGIPLVVEGKTFHVGINTYMEIGSLNYIYKTSWSLLPVFAFYHFAKKCSLTLDLIKRWLPWFMIVATLCFYLTGQQRMLNRGLEEVTNNGGYLVLSLVPLLLFMKLGSWSQYFSWAWVLLLVIYSMKRGAVLIALILVAIYFLYLFRNSRPSTYFSVIIALLIGLSGIYYVYDNMLATSEHFQERVDDTLEGDVNGRDVIQGYFVNYYLNEATFEEQIFGGGGNATLELFGMFAHNDWIELAINQGFLGMFVYLIYWLAFLRLLLKRNMRPDVKISLISLFVIYFLKTFFSMSYSQYTLYSSMALGYCIANSCEENEFVGPEEI